jgi:hypothetical protein
LIPFIEGVHTREQVEGPASLATGVIAIDTGVIMDRETGESQLAPARTAAKPQRFGRGPTKKRGLATTVEVIDPVLAIEDCARG